MPMHSLLPLLLLCASSSLLLLTATTRADNLTFYMYSSCQQSQDNTNYARGSSSAFQANLDKILSSLPTAAAASSSGFADDVAGAAPDQVYGLAQCRGDIGAEDCRACLGRSAREMAAGKCAGSKDAVLVYEGCLLRYSNASFFGETAADMSYPLYMCDPGDKATEPQFSPSLDALMHGLAEKAYGSPRLFAAGSADLAVYEKIYGMAQCTRDLGPDDCQGCLDIAVSKIQAYRNCSGIQDGRIFSSSCSIRFGVTPFYNAEAAMSTGSSLVRPEVPSLESCCYASNLGHPLSPREEKGVCPKVAEAERAGVETSKNFWMNEAKDDWDLFMFNQAFKWESNNVPIEVLRKLFGDTEEGKKPWFSMLHLRDALKM